MQNFRPIIYARFEKPGDPERGKIIAAAFPTELSVKGKKIPVGVYRLVNEVDVSGKPEPKKSDTEKTIKKKKKKARK